MSSGRSFHQNLVSLAATLLALSAVVIAQNISVLTQPPVIVKGPPPHVLYNVGKTIKLPCVATGIPEPRWEWLKDGLPAAGMDDTPISEVDQARGIEKKEEGVVWLKPQSSREEGYYQCRAWNDYGVALSNITYIQQAVLKSIRGGQNVRNVTVKAGHGVTLPCNHSLSIPKPRFEWHITNCNRGCGPDVIDRLVELNDRVSVDDNGQLVFSRVEESDAVDGFFYACQMENLIRRRSMRGSFTKLTVQPNPHHQNKTTVPALIYSSESPVLIMQGQNVSLLCFFSGWPIPTVGWKKEDSVLPKGRSSTNNFSYQLEIIHTRIEDSGYYLCTADNGVPSKPNRIYLDVQDKPTITQGPKSYNVTEWDDVVVTCKSTGKPRPVIHWYINDQLASDANVSFKWTTQSFNESDNMSTINLFRARNLRMHQTFTLHCNASNIHGYDFRASYVNVVPRPPTSEAPTEAEPTTEPPPVIINEKNKLLPVSDQPKKEVKPDTANSVNKGGDAQFEGIRQSPEEKSIEQTDHPPGTLRFNILIIVLIVVFLIILLIIILALVFIKKRRKNTYGVEEIERKQGRRPDSLHDGRSDDSGYIGNGEDRPLSTIPLRESRPDLPEERQGILPRFPSEHMTTVV